MSEMDINSHEYWNGRFERDWESNLGREQSRFFAKVALDNLPVWLTAAVKNGNWSVRLGCAQGDGTAVLADFFARNRVTASILPNRRLPRREQHILRFILMRRIGSMAMDSMRNSIWYSPRIRLNIFQSHSI